MACNYTSLPDAFKKVDDTNARDSSEDWMISDDLLPAWQWNEMDAARKQLRDDVTHMVKIKQLTCWDQVRDILKAYDPHEAVREGREGEELEWIDRSDDEEDDGGDAGGGGGQPRRVAEGSGGAPGHAGVAEGSGGEPNHE